MRKIISLAVLTLMAAFGQVSFAGNACQNDADEMQAEIERWGSITSPVDSVQFDDVGRVFTTRYGCAARGYHYGLMQCQVVWTPKNWGKTFKCH